VPTCFAYSSPKHRVSTRHTLSSKCSVQVAECYELPRSTRDRLHLLPAAIALRYLGTYDLCAHEPVTGVAFHFVRIVERRARSSCCDQRNQNTDHQISIRESALQSFPFRKSGTECPDGCDRATRSAGTMIWLISRTDTPRGLMIRSYVGALTCVPLWRTSRWQNGARPSSAGRAWVDRAGRPVSASHPRWPRGAQLAARAPALRHGLP
jgi:hypothetical protein